MSITVTPNPQELEYPELSVALQDTSVDPIENVEPEVGQLVDEGPQRSEAVALKDTLAPLAPVHSAVIGAGHVISGGVVSTTVTEELQELVFPEPSVASQSTVDDPSENVEPEVGLHVVPATEQLSVAVGLKEAVAPLEPVHSRTRGDGQLMEGDVTSTTLTVAVHESEASLSSVAVRVTPRVSPRLYGPGGA